jgi:hypothetical protein
MGLIKSKIKTGVRNSTKEEEKGVTERELREGEDCVIYSLADIKEIDKYGYFLYDKKLPPWKTNYLVKNNIRGGKIIGVIVRVDDMYFDSNIKIEDHLKLLIQNHISPKDCKLVLKR